MNLCKYCGSDKLQYCDSYYYEVAYPWKCISCGKYLEKEELEK